MSSRRHYIASTEDTQRCLVYTLLLKISSAAVIPELEFMAIKFITLKNRSKDFVSYSSRAIKGAQWLSGRVLDSRLRGRGLDPHRRHCVVSLSIYPCLVLVTIHEDPS